MEEITLLSLTQTAFLGESRYLNPLQVFGIGGRFDSTITDLELGVDPNNQQAFEGANRIDPDYHKLHNKITAVLNLVSFREQHVMVQFWSPRVNGKHQLLTTLDQPSGVGVIDERLRLYRQDSERYSFIVDKDHEEEDRSPVARVFRRELPEWTFDLNSYTWKQFPQQACAIRCGFHGYLGLPVFDSATGTCVGVMEILTASKYTSYAYEVQQLYNALKTVDLTTHEAFDCSTLNVTVTDERRLNVFDKIHAILKTVCDIHNLPLAQTWAVSQHASFVAHKKVIMNSCSSFDTKCVEKVCMSTTALPFCVKDLRVWYFREACKERHLDMSRGLVVKALLTRGSCFCEDVTSLNEEEYPLVHDARMNGLTGCFAIFLHSLEADDDYVLEFYLTPDIKDSGHVRHLVQTLNQNIPIGSGFELGQTAPTDPYMNMYSEVSQTSLDCMDDNSMNIMYTSDSDSIDSLATKTVTATIRFADETQIVQFPMSSRLSDLKIEVASIFELEGEIRLKYMDEENDEILIAVDDDLKSALGTADRYNSINLICQAPPQVQILKEYKQ